MSTMRAAATESSLSRELVGTANRRASYVEGRDHGLKQEKDEDGKGMISCGEEEERDADSKPRPLLRRDQD